MGWERIQREKRKQTNKEKKMQIQVKQYDNRN